MIKENIKIGDIGFYDEVQCECTEIVDNISIKVIGKFDKKFYISKRRHNNNILAFLGFKELVVEELIYDKELHISNWSFTNFINKKDKEDSEIISYTLKL